MPHPSSASYPAAKPKRGPQVRAPLFAPPRYNHSLSWYSQALRNLSSGAAERDRVTVRNPLLGALTSPFPSPPCQTAHYSERFNMNLAYGLYNRTYGSL